MSVMFSKARSNFSSGMCQSLALAALLCAPGLPARAQITGTIITVAGTGGRGFAGDGGPALNAVFNIPVTATPSSDGSFYITDWQNHRVRRVSANGIVTTVAGTGAAGYSGDGGAATRAALNQPLDVAVDSSG